LLYDIDNSTVVAISQGNDADAAKACFSQLSAKQLAGIEAISMDMSASYVKATKETIPLAEEKIVHDRFHLMQLASKAVDQTRRAEHKQLREAGDDRLTKTRYLWLKSQENLTEEERVRFDDVDTQQLETGRAWGLQRDASRSMAP
jgi:transposase